MEFELTREVWGTVWPEAQVLVERHLRELGESAELDGELLGAAAAAGALHVFGAREPAGRLVGYICWMVGRHPEQRGAMMAQQGPWFVLPETGIGRRLFVFSLGELRELGVSVAYPHHRWNQRGGERLGMWFEGLGARPLQMVYELKLGEI